MMPIDVPNQFSNFSVVVFEMTSKLSNFQPSILNNYYELDDKNSWQTVLEPP